MNRNRAGKTDHAHLGHGDSRQGERGGGNGHYSSSFCRGLIKKLSSSGPDSSAITPYYLTFTHGEKIIWLSGLLNPQVDERLVVVAGGGVETA